MSSPQVQPGRAALYILGGMMTLGISDNFVPFVTDDSSLWQFHLIRGGFVVVALIVASRLGLGQIWPRRPLAVIGRSLFTAGAMLIYFGCLALLPIGVVVAGLFTSPLFIVLISVFVQRKPVGPARWGAVAIGFIGALLVIRPDPASLDFVAFLPVFAGLLYAIGAVATRAWCEGEAATTLTLWFFGLLTVFGAIGVWVLPDGGVTGAAGFPIRGWMPLTASNLFWLAVQAIGALIGIVMIFRGYLLGEASFVGVFEYSLLIFASLWAYVLWNQTVPFAAVVGMALIAVAGAVIAVRSKADAR